MKAKSFHSLSLLVFGLALILYIADELRGAGMAGAVGFILEILAWCIYFGESKNRK